MTPIRSWLVAGGLVVGMTFVGLALRVPGLSWGLPGTSAYYHGSSFHPDEQPFFYALKDIRWREGRWTSRNVQMNSRGTLSLYLVGAVMVLAHHSELPRLTLEYLQNNPRVLGNLYRTGRWVSIICSLLAAALLFEIGRRALNLRVGLLGASLIAWTPVHVVNSLYISSDSILTALLVLVFGLSLAVFHRGRWTDYLACGMATGLLIACKYNMGTAVLIPLAAFAASPVRSWKKLGAAAAFSIAAFLASNPVVWMDPSAFREALAHSMRMNQHRDPYFEGARPIHPILFYWGSAPYYGLSPILFVITGAAVWWALTRWRNPHVFLWLPFAAVYTLLLTMSPWRLVRWSIPLTIPLLWWTALAADDLFQRRKRLAGALMGLGLLSPALYSYAYVRAMTPDIRIEASDWCRTHLKPGETIGFPESPYVWDPVIFQAMHYHAGKSFWKDSEPIPQWTTVALHHSWDLLKRTDPRYLVVNDFNSGQYWQGWVRGGDPETDRFYRALYAEGTYHCVARFSRRVRLGPLDLYGSSAFYPHDWRYPFPYIEILERKAPA